MAKRLKLRLSFPSIRLCRSEESQCLPQNPTLASNPSTPISPRAEKISYPGVPEAPPTTPNHHAFMARIVPISHRIAHNCSAEADEQGDQLRSCTSPASDTRVVRLRKIGGRMETNASFCTDAGWSDGEEVDSCWYSARSFGSSSDFGYPLETISEDPTEGVGGEVDGFVVKESVMVVKRSENPCEDFKRSMMEMIMEKKMYSIQDLEQLLQSVLSLNSAQYHGAIVEAFAEELADEACPPFSGIDASFVANIMPASEAIVSALTALQVGSVWVAQGCQVSTHDWELTHPGTIRTHLDDIAAINC